MNYILDRYIHYLLFLAMFLPLDQRWFATSFPKSTTKQTASSCALQQSLYISPGIVALKLFVVWIYVDAGLGKYNDPLKGWSYHADPLPALDTYARHTTSARYMYALLGPSGLRLLTPVVVWIELLAAPVTLVASFMGNRALMFIAITCVCSLHVGIALMLRNAALLSFLACTPWCVFLPLGWKQRAPLRKTDSSSSQFGPQTVYASRLGAIVSILLIGSMAIGNLWLASFSQACDQSVKHIWSTLLHNRWNVFVGAEEYVLVLAHFASFLACLSPSCLLYAFVSKSTRYVTWEIAPGLLADGSIVDVWGRSTEVSWTMPGTGAPCTSTARPGRWRSFPYLAGFEGDDAEALWGYLCKEWDRENSVEQYPGRQLLKYNFFMLQADVLPEMAFSATRKRLVHSHSCVLDLTDTAPVEDANDSTPTQETSSETELEDLKKADDTRATTGEL
jgi:hypothetical protein